MNEKEKIVLLDFIIEQLKKIETEIVKNLEKLGQSISLEDQQYYLLKLKRLEGKVDVYLNIANHFNLQDNNNFKDITTPFSLN